ncbi:hypothetical protein QUF72_17005 [Desulfobacterales bacterium HSG2]|nr:hypothetical protein [Desulfobacterales bacterium HSG2]
MPKGLHLSADACGLHLTCNFIDKLLPDQMNSDLLSPDCQIRRLGDENVFSW